jgi:hypothetical protein
LTTALRFPKFNEAGNIQEDGYEIQLKHLRLLQKQYPVLYRSLATTMPELAGSDLSLFKALLLYDAMWPHRTEKRSLPASASLEDLLDPSDKARVLPIRNITGLLDAARVYNVPEKEELSRALLMWSQSAGTPRLWLPGQEAWVLVTFVDRDRKLATFTDRDRTEWGWKHLYEDNYIRLVKQRYGLIASAPPPSTEKGPLEPTLQPAPSAP